MQFAFTTTCVFISTTNYHRSRYTYSMREWSDELNTNFRSAVFILHRWFFSVLRSGWIVCMCNHITCLPIKSECQTTVFCEAIEFGWSGPLNKVNMLLQSNTYLLVLLHVVCLKAFHTCACFLRAYTTTYIIFLHSFVVVVAFPEKEQRMCRWHLGFSFSPYFPYHSENV